MSINVYKQFLSLLPSRPLQVGDAIAVEGSLVTVELPDGGQIQVRGDATVGQRVFVRDGSIDGEAPSLAIEIIEV